MSASDRTLPDSTTTPAPAGAGAPEGVDRPLVWIDGEIVPAAQAGVSVFDRGVLFGDGIFEGLRCYAGRILKCRTHLERLMRSAEAIRLDLAYTIDQFDGIMRATLRANAQSDAYIRLVVTRGPGNLGLDPFIAGPPTVFCITDHLQVYPDEMYRNGMPVIVAERPRVPTECLDPSVKSCNYLNNILAKVEAIDAGVLEAIMLNTRGEVAECTGDNIFIVRDGVVSTPPAEAGILVGVTRGMVLDLAREEGIETQERPMSLDEVLKADEVFLTGTAAEVIGVSEVRTRTKPPLGGGWSSKKIGDGREGEITRRLREAFHGAIRAGAPED